MNNVLRYLEGPLATLETDTIVQGLLFGASCIKTGSDGKLEVLR